MMIKELTTGKTIDGKPKMKKTTTLIKLSLITFCHSSPIAVHLENITTTTDIIFYQTPQQAHTHAKDI